MYQFAEVLSKAAGKVEKRRPMLEIFQDLWIDFVIANAEFKEAIAADAWIIERLPRSVTLEDVSCLSW